MSRTETLVQMTRPLLELLDRAAAERGVSRSQVVRDAVAEHLGLEGRADVDRRIQEGYRRLPQSDSELGWGEASEREAWADLEW